MPPRILLPILLLCAFRLHAQSFAGPEPYGGNQAVAWLLEQEQQFPEADLAAGLNGEVVLAFSVLADGTVKGLRVQIPLCEACDAEAIRLARMIRWKPASVGGSNLDRDHTLSIPFHAKRYRRRTTKAKPCTALEGSRPADASFTLYTDRQVDSLAQPRITGGLRGLSAYLAANLKYPPEAYRLDIQGKVTIEFVVEASGSVSNLRTLNFLGGGCDTEAMRLARSVCWRPAIKDGQLVRSVMRFDIQFRLEPASR